MKLRTQAVLSIALIAGAAWLWSDGGRLMARFGVETGAESAAPREGRRAQRAIRVVPAEVRVAADDLVFEAIGTGRAQRSVTLRAESAGRIVETALAPDARFEAGAALLRLEETDQQLAVALAEARLEEAERTLERTATLDGRGVSSAAALDAARTAARVAALELAQARERLDDRVLRAPFAGVSSIPEVETGDRIALGDAVARFDDRSVLWVEFDAPERVLARLALGMDAVLESPAAPGVDIAGEVIGIDSRLDPRTRTARVRIAAPNPDDALRPGASFTVRLSLPGARFPVVPELALQFARDGLYVWRIDGDTADRAPVRLVRRRGDGVLIDGPLEAGDEVVVEGAQRLAPGRRIKAVEDPAAVRR